MEVRERLIFEVTDHQLDRGMVAMIDISGEQRHGAVGREAVMAPVGPQLRMGANQRVRRTISLKSPSRLSPICACPPSG
jgi:hypothetical protein